MVEEAGLKGYRVGGATVSTKPVNFFITIGTSTSLDMLDLIALVKEEVRRKFRVQ